MRLKDYFNTITIFKQKIKFFKAIKNNVWKNAMMDMMNFIIKNQTQSNVIPYLTKLRMHKNTHNGTLYFFKKDHKNLDSHVVYICR